MRLARSDSYNLMFYVCTTHNVFHFPFISTINKKLSVAAVM